MIWKQLVPLLLPVLAQAAVIRGTAVEHATGKPLSRTTVVAQPIGGTPGTALSKRTDRLGGFEFQSLAEGWYVVSFTRPGFANAEYGQKQWNSAGHPIFLEERAPAFLQVRMRRLGAISGTVLDEEDIGMPDHEVAVYRNTRPPEFLARAKTDDRGVYRIGGLMPGLYLLRTVGKHYEEGDYLPTFHRESRLIADAQSVEAMLDEQASNINLKPYAGRLVAISGGVLPMLEDVVVTLVSDTGRVEHRGPLFRFEGVPPGRYEIYAQSESGGVSGYADLAATASENRLTVRMVELSVGFRFYGARPDQVQVLARRRDLAGTSAPTRYPVGTESAVFAPGRWDFMLSTPPELYTARVQAPHFNPSFSKERPDGWITALIERPSTIYYTVSNKPGSITGVVTTAGREPVAGAPVFLEGWDPIERRRVIDLRETRTDLRGRYQFVGIPPGDYRILSTFEYRAPDSGSMDSAGAKEIKVVEAQSLALDLDLYVIR